MEHAQKTAAAIAAVLQYIKTEEEAIAVQSAMAAAAPQMPGVTRQPAPAVKPDDGDADIAVRSDHLSPGAGGNGNAGRGEGGGLEKGAAIEFRHGGARSRAEPSA